MHLYSLSLQRSTAISHCVYGAFSGPGQMEFVAAHGKSLELLRLVPGAEEGEFSAVSAAHQEVFGVVRALLAFRLTGGQRDYVVVGSDSGRLAVLEFNAERGCFERALCETYGRTGCRRIVPGQYLAADPKGRAVMVGAVEKHKLVYVMNRDASSRLTISSPLEANMPSAVTFSLVGVDVGFENPIFASLELSYSDVDEQQGEQEEQAEKTLVYYELDLGLNHVIRKWAEPVARSANLLVAVPGGADGPSGVLVCSEDCVEWRHQGKAAVRARLPRRAGTPAERGVLVVSAAMHRNPAMMFFLLQSELGDLFKATLEHGADGQVTDLVLTFFDTAPVANALCITHKGNLLLASEFGDHLLYGFVGLANDERVVARASAPEAPVEAFSLRPLANLVVQDRLGSLAPVTDMLVQDLCREDSPQIVTLCGRGPRSHLRVLRHGLQVSEVVSSPLPGTPTAVWTVKARRDAEHDSYIVVSFNNATLVLEIGESVREVTDTGFLASSPTLAVALLDDDALVQVHANGIRHIPTGGAAPDEWRAPGKKTIEHAAVSARQVVLSMAGGEVVYFELDAAGGGLVEMGTKELGHEVTAVELGEVPEGRQRAPFLAVGAWDNTVKILSLDPADLLAQRAVQGVPDKPSALCFSGALLYTGLRSGVLVRAEVDAQSGALSDARQRFLGAKAVGLHRVTVQGRACVLATSAKPWLCYPAAGGRVVQAPLSYDALEYAANFRSALCPEGVVGVAGNTLRILTVDALGETFNRQSLRLRYTPRRVVVHPNQQYLLVIEADCDQLSQTQREAAEPAAMDLGEAKGEEEDEDQEDEDEDEKPADRGPLPAQRSSWGSCIRIVDPVSMATVGSPVELDNNEAAVSLATCVFHDRGGETFVLVGTVAGMQHHPRASAGAFVRVYRLTDEGRALVLLHKTEVEDVPLAICEFHGRVLLGVGDRLRVCDLGKRQLLRKCADRRFPTTILGVSARGDRIYVTDMAESVHFVKYHRRENALAVFADDSLPRMTTAHCVVDYDSVALADKFGNLAVLRLPADLSDEADNPSGNRVLWDTGVLDGGAKLEQLTQFHLGELITAVRRTELVPGGASSLVVSTVAGSIGTFLPFETREDVDFFSHLEILLRTENAPLCGRDQLAYRSWFLPCKATVDGDMCETFCDLPPAKQRQIATELDRTPAEVVKKLEDIRNRVL